VSACNTKASALHACLSEQYSCEVTFVCLNKTADTLRTNHLCTEHLMQNTMASASMRNGEAKEKEIAFSFTQSA